MNRMFISLLAVTALASCNREEKSAENKSGTPPSAQEKPSVPPSGADKTTPPPTAGDAAAALKAAFSDRAKKTSASTATMVLANAVQQFENDYALLPQPASATKGIDCITDTGGEEGVVAILKGRMASQNPKAIDFMADVKDAKAEGGKHVNGMKTDGEMVAYYDPWGQLYHLALDLDGDGNVEDPSAGPKAAAAPAISKKFIIWSDGPDGKQDTWEDNVCSWK